MAKISEGDGYQEAQRRIARAKRTDETELDLRELGLTALPAELWALSALRMLELSGNQLTALPAEIGSLSGLDWLYLSGNQLTALPAEFGALTALGHLTLQGNQLTTLPPEIGALTALVMLDVQSNRLTTLPPEIGSLTALSALLLNNNQLTALPPEIGSLTALRAFHSWNNVLGALPPEIGSLSALQDLDLTQNQLSALPAELGQLTNLTRLFLHDNPDLGLPPEILGPRNDAGGDPRPPQEILEYYFSLERSKRAKATKPLNEAKVLFLGEPESGKSSLIHALTVGFPTPHFEQTDGIARETLNLKTKDGKVLTRGGEGFRLNLWDFGGQEIYKATHTFFLTKRAVYVIVTTARKDTRVDEDLEEWLETARTFGSGAPVWIVINKHDENPTGGPDEDALIRKYHPMLRGFIRTQCQHARKGPDKGKGAGLGIQELRDALLAEAWAIPEARQQMSKSSLALKASLEKMKTPTLTVDQYRAKCKQLGVESKTLQDALLDLWDKLGTVRYFPEHADDAPSMQETAILNPEWITEPVYKVIGSETLKKRHGVVKPADIHRILKDMKNPVGGVDLIISVMRRFSHLYDSYDGRMFIPLLLEDREPKMDWPDGSLRFVYEYPVLPAGLIPSFIARMHQFHDKAVTPWRKGCVLAVQGCRVRVLGDKKLRQVQISVIDGQGSQRRDALDQVRFKFEELHAGMTGMDSLKELIPVPGHPKAPMLNYRFLRTLEDDGETHLPAPLDAQARSAEQVIIAEALGSIRGVEMKAREERTKERSGSGDTYIKEYIAGDKNVDDHSTNIGRDVINSQVGQTLTNCTNTIQQQAPGEKKDLLEELRGQVEEIINNLPDDKTDEAPQVADNLEMLIKHATSAKPNPRWYEVSAEGLLEASEWTKDFAGNIVGTIGQLKKLIWPDYSPPNAD